MKDNMIKEKIKFILKTKVPFLPLYSVVYFDRKFNYVASFKQPKVLNLVYVFAKTLKSFIIGREIKLKAIIDKKYNIYYIHVYSF